MRWEYKIVEFKKMGFLSSQPKLVDIQAELSNLGRAGWELVSVSKRVDDLFGQGNIMYFKKPIE